MREHSTSSPTQVLPGGRFRISKDQDSRVRVADFVLRSVGFIGEATSADSVELQGDLHATGFFVAAPSSLPGRSYAFFVTAKHVADDLKDRAIYFLVNKKGGGVTALD